MRVLRNATLADGRSADIHIDTDSGTIRAVTASGSTFGRPGNSGHTAGKSASTVTASGSTFGRPGRGPTTTTGNDCTDIDDLGGWLTLPAMAEPHAHVDKAFTADAVHNPRGDLRGAIDGWADAAAADAFSYRSTVQRATRALETLLVHGVTAVRTHVNVLSSTGAANVLAVREASRGLAGMIDVQVVAMTGSPMTGPEGAANRRAMEAALDVGVDLVGGCPHHDPDPPAHIAMLLAVAADAGIGLDLHVDETLDPEVLTLRDVIRQTASIGFTGAVAASHCVSLGMQSPGVQTAVASEVAAVGVSVITLPQTNLFLQGRDQPTGTPRGITAVKALQDAGAAVAGRR